MARSYDIAILSQKVEQMEGSIKANDVIANPTGETTADLTAVQIDGTKYKVSKVEANPEAAATTGLTKIGVNGTVYSVPGIYDDIAVVEGTLAAGDNEFDYPTGFNVSNCVIISVMYSPGTDRWDTLPNSNYNGILGSLRATKVVFYNGATALNDKPGRIVLRKIPVATQSTRSRKKKEE